MTCKRPHSPVGKVLMITGAVCLLLIGVEAGEVLRYRSALQTSERTFRRMESRVSESSASGGEGKARRLPGKNGGPGRYYRELIRSRNGADLAGWIRVPGTGISYPVMYVKGNNTKYLHRDFYGKASPEGVPFLEGRSDPCRTGNLMIYGHHMRSGAVFGRLEEYFGSRAGRRRHPALWFDRIHRDGSSTREYYRVCCSFFADTRKQPCYLDYSGIYTRSGMKRYLRLVGAGKMPASSRTLTLSTCAYHIPRPYGRFAVVFVRKE